MKNSFCQDLPYLFGIAYNILGNVADAEDAVQEVYLKFLKKKPLVYKSLRSYMARMVYNHCIDLIRKQSKSVSLQEIAEIAVCDQVDFHQELDSELGNWLALLEVKDRLVLDLFYREELSIGEISDVIGDSKGAVKVRLHRARQKLREISERKGSICERT